MKVLKSHEWVILKTKTKKSQLSEQIICRFLSTASCLEEALLDQTEVASEVQEEVQCGPRGLHPITSVVIYWKNISVRCDITNCTWRKFQCFHTVVWGFCCLLIKKISAPFVTSQKVEQRQDTKLNFLKKHNVVLFGSDCCCPHPTTHAENFSVSTLLSGALLFTRQLCWREMDLLSQARWCALWRRIQEAGLKRNTWGHEENKEVLIIEKSKEGFMFFPLRDCYWSKPSAHVVIN